MDSFDKRLSLDELSGFNVKLPLCVLVNIKWGKEKFESVHVNTDEPPLVFKATIFSLSGVQPDRQKIMIKGAVLKVSTLVSF